MDIFDDQHVICYHLNMYIMLQKRKLNSKLTQITGNGSERSLVSYSASLS